MAEANTDERTLVIKDDENKETVYKVSEMKEEAKILYSKLELIGKESRTVKANAEFKLEQNDILQKHYLEAIRPLLSSEEEQTEEVESDKPKKKNN